MCVRVFSVIACCQLTFSIKDICGRCNLFFYVCKDLAFLVLLHAINLPLTLKIIAM